ncbi:MAG: hypothetical protein WBW73_11725 [Rhodoplanes sp.]
MRALILYTVLVVIGTVIAVFIGLFVERQITVEGSVMLFLALFFANFLRVLDDHEGGGRAHAETVGRGRRHPLGISRRRSAKFSLTPRKLAQRPREAVGDESSFSPPPRRASGHGELILGI